MQVVYKLSYTLTTIKGKRIKMVDYYKDFNKARENEERKVYLSDIYSKVKLEACPVLE